MNVRLALMCTIVNTIRLKLEQRWLEIPLLKPFKSLSYLGVLFASGFPERYPCVDLAVTIGLLLVSYHNLP